MDDLGVAVTCDRRSTDYLALVRTFRFLLSEPEGTGVIPTDTPVSFGVSVLSLVPLCGDVSPPDFCLLCILMASFFLHGGVYDYFSDQSTKLWAGFGCGAYFYYRFYRFRLLGSRRGVDVD